MPFFVSTAQTCPWFTDSPACRTRSHEGICLPTPMDIPSAQGDSLTLGTQDVRVMISSSLLWMSQWSAWDKEGDLGWGPSTGTPKLLSSFPSLPSEEVWSLIKSVYSHSTSFLCEDRGAGLI